MNSITMTMAIKASSFPSYSSCFPRLVNPNSLSSRLKIYKKKERTNLFLKSLKCVQNQSNHNLDSSSSSSSVNLNDRNPSSSVSFSEVSENSLGNSSELVKSNLQRIVSEFESLSEAIDRVKRLLHYAALLPGFDESKRVPSSKVMGCTAQVWLDVNMDENGRMRFFADSDSEITKGFCSCLIWVLDGAQPDEVLKLKSEDLIALNVGFSGRANSRVNTWHNVLISMQKRTKAFAAEREGKPPVDTFPSLAVDADDIVAKGSYAEAQMNTLSSLRRVCHHLPDDKSFLLAYESGSFSS